MNIQTQGGADVEIVVSPATPAAAGQVDSLLPALDLLATEAARQWDDWRIDVVLGPALVVTATPANGEDA